MGYGGIHCRGGKDWGGGEVAMEEMVWKMKEMDGSMIILEDIVGIGEIGG